MVSNVRTYRDSDYDLDHFLVVGKFRVLEHLSKRNTNKNKDINNVKKENMRYITRREEVYNTMKCKKLS